MTRTLFQIVLIFFVFTGSANFQEFYPERKSFSCKRIVKEKDRCLIYNYTHPDCKKWDRSGCPPPRIHRERGPCVSYKCTRIAGWAPRPTTTPVPVTVTSSTPEIERNLTKTNVSEVSQAPDRFGEQVNSSRAEDIAQRQSESESSREQTETLVEDLDDLRNEIDALKLVQSEDISRLEKKKDKLSNELNDIREKVSQQTNKLQEEVTERLHTQEIKVEEQLQDVEEKIFQTNFTIFRRLLHVERQLGDIHNLVLRLHSPSNGSQVYQK